tara:strand:+ start:468 stop:1835 length:1368 start_codon:yes stop_codon:yes gene_type:complete
MTKTSEELVDNYFEQKVIKARARLMSKDVGIASMLLNLKLVKSTDIDTMATDGTQILWNADFVSKVSDEEVEAVLIHEALHVVFEHPLRFGNRNHKLWNVACDYAINNYLYYNLNYPLPEGGLWDYSYYQKTAEEIYRILDNDDEALQEAINEASESQSSDDDTGDSQGDGSDAQEDAQNKTETGKYSDGGDGDGEPVDKYAEIPSLVGEIIEPKDEEGNKLDSQQVEAIADNIRSKLFLADKTASLSGTSSLRGAVEKVKGQTSDWREVLRDVLDMSISRDHTWARPNRRHFARGVYLPSNVKLPTGGEVAIAIDTSGSISQHELNIYAVEIEEIVRSLNLEKVRVCYCDTTINSNDQGEFWDVFDLSSGEEINLEMRGGGGTAFDPPFNLFNDHSDDVDDVCAFIYFTDGWGMVSPDVEPDVPVVWAITDEYRSHSQEMPFGEVVHVDVRDFS